MIYLYNYAGQPWKAQHRAREVMDNLYSPAPDGYCGDEDNGQTSAWYVFSALGFYPVCPGIPEYVIGSPLFDKATIKLENGKILEIVASNNSAENIYIQKVEVNGEEYQYTYLPHEMLMKGGKIEFYMGAEPNKKWATSPESRPYSLTNEVNP